MVVRAAWATYVRTLSPNRQTVRAAEDLHKISELIDSSKDQFVTRVVLSTGSAAWPSCSCGWRED